MVPKEVIGIRIFAIIGILLSLFSLIPALMDFERVSLALSTISFILYLGLLFRRNWARVFLLIINTFSTLWIAGVYFILLAMIPQSVFVEAMRNIVHRTPLFFWLSWIFAVAYLGGFIIFFTRRSVKEFFL